jgi:Na+-driven multidrug efflux pump
LAAISFIAPIEMVAVGFVCGICSGASILVSQSLGAKNFKSAYEIAVDSIIVSTIIGVLTAGLCALLMYVYFTSFSYLEPSTRSLILSFIPLLASGVIIRAIAASFIQGVLKAGGDNKYCLYVDIICQLLVFVPFIVVSIFYFDVSLMVAYFIFQLEGLLKIILCFPRVVSKKWIRCLA